MNATQHTITRRKFVEASTVAAAGAALLSATGCSSEASLDAADKHELPTDPAEDGEWIPAACWHNCGGRCVNKVMVKDGAVIRQKTDDSHEDSFDYPQQRGCVRGKAQQQQCFGADRIMHPLKRKGWQPGGGENSNGQMRGKDEWETISWDDAIDLSCQEIKRIKDEYGGDGFYIPGNTASDPLLNAIGGTLSSWETMSMGTYQFDATMFGLPSMGLGKANDRLDMLNADTIIMYSSNPVWSAAGTPIMNYIRAKEAGVNFICVDPLYNASAEMLDAEWYPVLNGTDMAFLLGVAYEMLRLDKEEGDIIDWDFLHTYCVGFDAQSMPADAKTEENFQDYVLGNYDGTPKTPEWASARCGIPKEQITEFARIMGKNNNVMTLHNFAFARTHGAEQIPQMLMTISCMGGHIGKSGNCYGSAYHANCGNAGSPLLNPGAATAGTVPSSIKYWGRTSDVFKVIAAGGGTFTDVGNAAYGLFTEPKQVTIGPVKCIIHLLEASMQTSIDQKDDIAAHRAVDFVLSTATFMTANAHYSDIILPLNTWWERPGGVVSSNREFIYAYRKVTDSLGESKSDQEISTLILEGLGMDPSTVYPVSEEQAYYEQVAGSTIVGSDGNSAPLVTITQSDIDNWGVDGTPQQGVVSLRDFISNGGYQVPRSADDGLGFIGYEDFIEDPQANPLPSASGKFEIYCQAHDEALHSFGFPNHEAYKPYPVYVDPPAHQGYAATFENHDIESGIKGEFPYLLYNPHYLRRSHSVFDNCPWLREAWGNPVFISRTDADNEGIKEGDTVLITTYAGQTLRKAAVLETLRPGVVGLPHGAWVDIDEDSGIDKAGSDNYLIGDEYSGMGPSGYNNETCRIEKYSGEPLQDDWALPARWSSSN